jgi:hypothetical protein
MESLCFDLPLTDKGNPSTDKDALKGIDYPLPRAETGPTLRWRPPCLLSEQEPEPSAHVLARCGPRHPTCYSSAMQL